MRRTVALSLTVLAGIAMLAGCAKSPGPLFMMDRAAVEQVRRVAILPVTNLTGYDMVNPILERLFVSELANLGRYELVNTTEVSAAVESLGFTGENLGNPLSLKRLGEYLNADAVIGAAITAYSPFGTEAALVGKETKEAEKHIEPPKGILGWLVPDKVSVAETRYQYGTVTKEPAIGAVVVMVSMADGRTIYEASKLIQADAGVPGTYRLTYSGVLSTDELRRIDFIARLVVKEMLEPLRSRS